MNREIKFKAWSKINKRFWDWNYLKGYLIFEIFEKLKNDLILIQYTGLNDKNGKPVYEGDIVKFNNNSIGHVVYNKFEYKFIIDCNKTEFDLSRFIYEIIGNIFEHPELLKDK